jgi:uncharacterized lipoprotein YmbA
MRLCAFGKAALVCTIALAGCGASPEPFYYTLAPTPGVAAPAPLAGHAIEVRQPSIAGYLDRSEIVVQVVEHRLRLASNQRWSEPLGLMIARILADDLTERLPGSTVFSEAAHLSVEPTSVVELGVRKFDLDADGFVRLKALLVVRSGAGQSARAVALQARPKTSETSDLATSMSDLLGQLADEIAGALRTSVREN